MKKLLLILLLVNGLCCAQADISKQEQLCAAGDQQSCAALDLFYSYQYEMQAVGDIRLACDDKDSDYCALVKDIAPFKEDYKKIAVFFDISCAQGKAIYCQILGDINSYQHNENYALAAQYYQQACAGGVAEGCQNLAFAYDGGFGVDEDKNKTLILHKKAIELYIASCEKGNAFSCAALGRIYANAFGVIKQPDYNKSAQFSYKACDNGIADNCINLGGMYIRAEQIEKDYAKAADLFQKACAISAFHCGAIGAMYVDDKFGMKDLSLAIKYYAKACNEGEDYETCYVLADRYMLGSGVEQDYKKAAEFFKKALELKISSNCFGVVDTYEHNIPWVTEFFQQGCQREHPLSCAELGAIYAKDTATAAKAVELYRQACTVADLYACGRLGAMYYQGKGVTRDYKTAAQLYKKAFNTQYFTGCAMSSKKYNQGKELGQNYKNAAQYYKNACDAYDFKSCAMLGYIYQYAQGVERDIPKANKYFKMSKEAEIGIYDSYLIEH